MILSPRFRLLAAALCFASVPAFAAATKLSLGTGTAKNKEELVYNPSTLKVKAGSKVTLTFKNNGTSKGMTHNFVLTQPGKVDAVVAAAVSAGPDKNWTPDSADIIAKTKLIDAGEKTTVEFTAPSTPGDYPFVCTFPGHSATMKGTLKVTK